MNVIALCGTAGAGKSTIADYLVSDLGYTRIKFADGLKNMLRSLGLDEDEIEGSRKEKPCALLCGKTPRHAMVTLGTEWGRNLIGPDFWTTIWRERVATVLNSGGRVVVDDMRFPNEADAATDAGAFRMRVVRPMSLMGLSSGHVSESFITMLPVDAEITNDDGVDELIAQAAKHILGPYGEPA
jgi:hypothetical protein